MNTRTSCRLQFWLLLALALSGCVTGRATVEVTGLEDFGPAQSTVWLVTPSVGVWIIDGAGTLTRADDAQINPLTVRDYASTCGGTRADLEAWGRASQTLVAAVGEGGNVGIACDEMTALDNAGIDHPAKTRHFFSAGLDTGSVTAERGRHEVSGGLHYIVEGGDCGGWNPGTCSFDPAAEDCDVATMYWPTQGGMLEIVDTGNEVVGTLDAALINGGDEVEGEIYIEFEAPVCEIDPGGTLVAW